MVGAQTAYSGICDNWLKELNTDLTSNRDFLVKFITENIPEISTTVPDATYLAWLDCNNLIENEIISTKSPYEFLVFNKAKVALNDWSSFGDFGMGFERFKFWMSTSKSENWTRKDG